jgi:Fe-S cluster assembly protein SufD
MKLPTSSLEEWRYSRIDSLDLDRFEPAGPDTRPGGPHLAGSVPLVEAARLSAAEVTAVETVDGRLSVLAPAAGSGVEVTVLSQTSEQPQVEWSGGGLDAFGTANEAFSVDPILIEVTSSDRPATVVVAHHCLSDGLVSFPRVTVRTAPGANLTLIEVLSGDAACLVVPVVDLDVAVNARVVYLGVQALGGRAWQIASQSSRVATGASLTSGAVALGGDYARVLTSSSLTGVGASSRLAAMYFASGSEMHDFRTVQDHKARKTFSDLLYKGVVANKASSVYSGLIRVEKGAKGTKAFQTNRNLVLHEGARAESVPNLEIEENDVSCSHASAIGPVSEDERFYLHSRGVPPQVADRLISVGFLTEVLEQLPLGALASHVEAALSEKLATAEAAEAAEAAGSDRQFTAEPGREELT